MKSCSQGGNATHCTCTYAGCHRKHNCCACVAYHRDNGELPGCFFPPEAERSYDRSVRKFIEIHQKR